MWLISGNRIIGQGWAGYSILDIRDRWGLGVLVFKKFFDIGPRRRTNIRAKCIEFKWIYLNLVFSIRLEFINKAFLEVCNVERTKD